MWPFHRHVWKEVNRQFLVGQSGLSILLGRSESSLVTIIMYKCLNCLKHQQEQLDGHVRLV